MKGRFFGLNPDFFRQTLSCLFLVVVLTTCFNPLDYSPSGNNGLISIALPGAGPAKAAITPGDLTYTLVFSGPNGQSITRTAAWGETCTVETPPGLWTVTVTAKDGSTTKAIGKTVVDVIAGSQNSADIKLAVYTEVSDWTQLQTAIAGNTPVDSGFADELIVVTGPITATGTITFSDNKTVTIVARENVAITRVVSGFTNEFFDITGSGAELILGSPDYTGELTFDGNNLGSAVLIKVTSGKLTMNNGVTLTQNAGGAVECFGTGTFIMNGGNITKNTRGSGAGVYTTGTFIMNGGVIGGSATDKNDATYGGGVYIATGGEFTMNGGEISYNDAVTNGGGVSINSTGVFTMNGGVINGNTASTGAGIFNTGAVFNISGNALVDENNEVYLASGKTITVTGPLTQPQALKVTLNSFTLGTPVLTPGFPAGTIGKIGFTNGARSLDSDGKLAVVEPAMRYVPPTPSSGFAFDNSGTTYYSEITTGYWMGETEVTQELWEAVMTGSAGNLTPSSFSSSPASDEDQFKRPVERISWYDALEFCNRLSEAAGKEPVYDLTVISRNTYGDKSITAATVDATWTKNGYRLPTEMEWWWAATGASMVAGTAEKAFSGSTGTIMENAWYQDGISSPYVTHQVGLKLPNELGIHDMTGNVSEWCWDWHDTTAFYGNHTNYTGPLSGTTRVVKGGYHASMPAACTLNYRDNRSPGNLVNYIGVRVVCNQ